MKNSQNLQGIILKSPDKKYSMAMCLWLVMEQVEDFNRTVRVRKEVRSGHNPSEIAIPALDQMQVNTIYREGRYLLLLPLFFLIRSDIFTDPEYHDLVSVAIALSQITDDTTRDRRHVEPEVLADVRKILTKYLFEEDENE